MLTNEAMTTCPKPLWACGHSLICHHLSTTLMWHAHRNALIGSRVKRSCCRLPNSVIWKVRRGI
jgi:hypothetical protein